MGATRSWPRLSTETGPFTAPSAPQACAAPDRHHNGRTGTGTENHLNQMFHPSLRRCTAHASTEGRYVLIGTPVHLPKYVLMLLSFTSAVHGHVLSPQHSQPLTASNASSSSSSSLHTAYCILHTYLLHAPGYPWPKCMASSSSLLCTLVSLGDTRRTTNRGRKHYSAKPRL